MHCKDFECFEQNLLIAQNLDPAIQNIQLQLQEHELKDFEMINGLVYRKNKGSSLFYVPARMEHHVMRNSHDDLGHIGIDKTCEYISRAYWFPDLKSKVKTYIRNSLKCISYSSNSGKQEGKLHSIPKGNRPFIALHIDHYGSLEITPVGKNMFLRK